MSYSAVARKNRKIREAREAARQATLIPPTIDPGIKVPIRTPTIRFCRKSGCGARITITDLDVRNKEFLECPICGANIDLFEYKDSRSSRVRAVRAARAAQG